MSKTDSSLLGEIRFSQQVPPTSIRHALTVYNVLDEADIGPAAAFILKCLQLDPERRPGADELLKDTWLSSSPHRRS